MQSSPWMHSHMNPIIIQSTHRSTHINPPSHTKQKRWKIDCLCHENVIKLLYIPIPIPSAMGALYWKSIDFFQGCHLCCVFVFMLQESKEYKTVTLMSMLISSEKDVKSAKGFGNKIGSVCVNIKFVIATPQKNIVLLVFLRHTHTDIFIMSDKGLIYTNGRPRRRTIWMNKCLCRLKKLKDTKPHITENLLCNLLYRTVLYLYNNDVRIPF